MKESFICNFYLPIKIYYKIKCTVRQVSFITKAKHFIAKLSLKLAIVIAQSATRNVFKTDVDRETKKIMWFTSLLLKITIWVSSFVQKY
jgi:hypothetical protein